MKFRWLLLLVIFLAVGSAFAQDAERTVITLENASQLQPLIRLGRGSAEHVTWSPDGTSILVGGSIGVWKYDAAALDSELEPALINPQGEVVSFSISPDGNTVAIYHSKGDEIEFRDFETGDLISTLATEYTAYQLGYSSDGKYLVVHQSNYGFTIFDVENQSIYTQTEISLDSDVPVIFNAENTRIAAAASNYSVLLWDLEAGGEPMELTGHTSSIEDLAFSPDGTILASASSDDTVHLWNTTDGTEMMVLQGGESPMRDVYAVAFSADGSTLLTGHSGQLRFWDAATGQQTQLIELADTVRDIVFSPDGSQFVVLVSYPLEAVQLYQADGTLTATTFYHNASVYAIDFDPQSAVLAFSDGNGYLYLWDTAAPQEITFSTRVEKGATSGIENKSNLTYSSDGRYLATLQSFSATLRNPVTGDLIREFSEVEGIAEDIEFSPDNTMLALITSQGLYVFNVETGELLASFNDANDWVQEVSWSPDQTMIATASLDQAVRVYAIGE